MRTVLTCLAACLLGACSALPRADITASPCVDNEASYECQVERYSHVHAD
jgi:hypothetical protein